MKFRIPAKAEILLDDDREVVGMDKDWEIATRKLSLMEMEPLRTCDIAAQDVFLEDLAKHQMSPIQPPEPDPYDSDRYEKFLLVYEIMDE